MASVTLEHIYKRFGDLEAVKDQNLEIRDKEFIVLVGPSGCGKSTTLRMIAGLEEISEGTLKIGENVVNDVAPKDRDIAMVFQNYALYPHMNVYDNMAFGLKLRKFPKDEIERRVQEAADILGIEQLLERKPKQLSGGQRQRVALGRAIVREPQVFLMDEPLSNLDAKLRVQMRTELSKLHDELQTTMIYVTHDQTEAMTMGDRIVVLKDGVIQQVDDPLSLYNKPNNMFVAGFIGSPAMNFMDATIEKEGNTYFVDGDGTFRIRVPEDKEDYIKDYEGKEVVFGVRPEDIVDTHITHDFEVKEDNSFEADVDVVEPMGSEIYLYLAESGHSLIARVEAESTAQVGDTISLGVDLRKIHIFDAETEECVF
ncbi:carbohydrate ABC transporter ATP-binding protein (CUT1 family) [Halanaerobium saccharolyticum]|uniref:Carbohydrate ABC transporter ATP-binding protein (CUT1 family) n=1 Tax=Halanaerobium saccharolyticum TaxID=43595 RepID=A0A4R7YV87_9FIRM|nr:sn-glycerol-3-phosphate ABC transporter ATP-binding protein UgpC [Halanaerobium saccharolyticum]RAK05126.1 carbohydrate ABC transporter ATP-binding protein (CUT1 family) [Halanaerobium saccharolyticum]TDV98893.1 carbohydrate ABC transporter ATP-binding protein (CUT1 family) [Halanaerobium saccharolyticum]TDX51595.1 carbohydrate ABC transporter ATP-binding protein (CUT1 family) [Halanaerobium saccharolyticum]